MPLALRALLPSPMASAVGARMFSPRILGGEPVTRPMPMLSFFGRKGSKPLASPYAV
jgi:hypothetical protein